MTNIRLISPSDWSLVWRIIEPVFRAGETYMYSPDISQTDAHRIWVETPAATYVVEDELGEVLGTYYLKPNQPGLGAHVCNCGYIVGEKARGKGVATALCLHSQVEAKRLGFRGIQFNSVVSTNEGAVRLWRKLGFEIVGTVPNAFHHWQHGFVDIYVMYKPLLIDKE
ncbi:MAG: GNAT family N-acetyltransferase [Merismopedia sp. SIO2A8]|nr:GNAT family N-acetyltransferase [Symploca sp. SIO2B6]NET53327.1 GNAT family N-acetyltransferase [Merismopedia sp. SIO2A8]